MTDHEQIQREAENTARMIADIHALTGISIAKINCQLDERGGSWYIRLCNSFDEVSIDMLYDEYIIVVSSTCRNPERTIALAELMLQAAKIVTELLEAE